jgi:hypothetical protein
MTFWRRLKYKFNGASNTAFGRIATADQQLQDAKGKIVAIRDSQNAKRSAAANLKSEAEQVHAEQDAIDKDIKAVHDLLG